MEFSSVTTQGWVRTRPCRAEEPPQSIPTASQPSNHLSSNGFAYRARQLESTIVGTILNRLTRSCGAPQRVLAPVFGAHYCGRGVDKQAVSKTQRFDQVGANNIGSNGDDGQRGIPLSELRRVQNLRELALAVAPPASSKALMLLGLEVVKDNACISWSQHQAFGRDINDTSLSIRRGSPS